MSTLGPGRRAHGHERIERPLWDAPDTLGPGRRAHGHERIERPLWDTPDTAVARLGR